MNFDLTNFAIWCDCLCGSCVFLFFLFTISIATQRPAAHSNSWRIECKCITKKKTFLVTCSEDIKIENDRKIGNTLIWSLKCPCHCIISSINIKRIENREKRKKGETSYNTYKHIRHKYIRPYKDNFHLVYVLCHRSTNV